MYREQSDDSQEQVTDGPLHRGQQGGQDPQRPHLAYSSDAQDPSLPHKVSYLADRRSQGSTRREAATPRHRKAPSGADILMAVPHPDSSDHQAEDIAEDIMAILEESGAADPGRLVLALNEAGFVIMPTALLEMLIDRAETPVALVAVVQAEDVTRGKWN